MLIIDKCAYTNNLKDKSATIKLVIAMIGILMCMVIKSVYMYISIIILANIGIICLAKIDIKIYKTCLKIPLYFLLLSIFINLINISVNKDNLMYSIKVLNVYLGVSNQSILNSIYLFLRSIACIVSIYFFILTTPFNDLINVLKKIHIPDTLIELIMLTYRFIFIFLEEVEEIYKSQQLKFGYINLKNSYKSTGLMINMLFLRLIKRYEDMSIALDIKMYDGKFHV